MNPQEICELDDERLVALSNALRNELERRKLPFAKPFFKVLEELDDDNLLAAYELAEDEEYKRAKQTTDVQIAHDVEQGEAAEASGTVDVWRRLLYRCASLHKFANLKAPKNILQKSLELVITAMEGIE